MTLTNCRETACDHLTFSFFFVNSGILVPGGFGIRGTEGKILAANWARTKNVPYLGKGDFFLHSTHTCMICIN